MDTTDETRLRAGRAADVARDLNISKQAVGKLIRRREKNGFPPPLPGETKRYDLDLVNTWYTQVFNPRGHRRGPRAAKKAER